MKQVKGFMYVLVAIGGILLLASCGGSSGGSSSSGGDSVPQLNNLSDVPDEVINPQQYDLTTRSISGSSSSKSLGLKAGDEDGGFSSAGCEVNRMKKMMIQHAIMPRMIICDIKAIEEAAGRPVAGDGEFNYWKMPDMGDEGPQGPAELDTFAPRVAIKKDGSTLTFVMCNEEDKVVELVFSNENDTYTGHVVNIFGDFKGIMEFDVDGTPENFTTARFTESFSGSLGGIQRYGSETLEATPDHNTVYGFYNESGTNNFSGAVYSRFDETQGSAKFQAYSGSYPATTVEDALTMCQQYHGDCGNAEGMLSWLNGGIEEGGCGLNVDENTYLCFRQDACPELAPETNMCEITEDEAPQTASFNISRDDSSTPPVLTFTVANTSDYAETVVSASLEEGQEPTIEFTSASSEVDCSESASWEEVTFTETPDLSECQAMEEEMNNWEPGDICEKIENINPPSSD